jgi:hypothetical protein
MGTSYEGLLAVADLGEVREALVRSGGHGLLASVAAARTALVPTETYGGVADIESTAEDISRECRCGVLAHGVYDSDVLTLWVYRDGTRVHRYVSEAGALGEVFEDRDGLMKVKVDGVVYAESDPARPSGPIGADPREFLPFAFGRAGVDQVAAALTGDGYGGDAEGRHCAFLRALNLDSVLLREAYDHLDPSEVEGAVRV